MGKELFPSVRTTWFPAMMWLFFMLNTWRDMSQPELVLPQVPSKWYISQEAAWEMEAANQYMDALIQHDLLHDSTTYVEAALENMQEFRSFLMAPAVLHARHLPRAWQKLYQQEPDVLVDVGRLLPGKRYLTWHKWKQVEVHLSHASLIIVRTVSSCH